MAIQIQTRFALIHNGKVIFNFALRGVEPTNERRACPICGKGAPQAKRKTRADMNSRWNFPRLVAVATLFVGGAAAAFAVWHNVNTLPSTARAAPPVPVTVAAAAQRTALAVPRHRAWEGLQGSAVLVC